jgi:hypothetical protein
MGCCNKRKKAKTKNLLENQNILLNSLKQKRIMSKVNPKELTNKKLNDYHLKTHMLYAGNIKRLPDSKQFVNSIVSLHDKFVKEMLSRGIKHNSPLRKV